MTNKYNIGDTLRILEVNHRGLATEERKKYIGKTFEVVAIDKHSTGICYAGSEEFSSYIFYEDEVEAVDGQELSLEFSNEWLIGKLIDTQTDLIDTQADFIELQKRCIASLENEPLDIIDDPRGLVTKTESERR